MNLSPDSPTIASEEAYAEWRDAVIAELQARGLDVAEALDWYSFRSAYAEFEMTPAQAVSDYQEWMQS